MKPAELARRTLRVVSMVMVLTAASGCHRDAPDLPKLGAVAPFELTDQRGQSFSSVRLRSTAWVGAFFFTRCPTVCPRITARMHALQAWGNSQHLDFKLLSISIDPDFDTPEVLAEYAKQHGVDPSRWTLLTGSAERIKELSEGTFRLAMSGRPNPEADHYGMIHAGHLVLIDREGLLRGYYRSSDDAEMRRLERDLLRVAGR
jgi:protein SCO1/2